MKQKWMFILAGLIIAIGMIGWTRSAYYLVTQPSGAGPQTATAPLTEAQAMKADSSSEEIRNPALDRMLIQAKEDLAARLSIQIDEIDLVEMRPVIWPDSSFGCPKPDMAYTQVQCDGLLILLKARDQIYEYHSGSGQKPFLCEEPFKAK